MDIYERLTRMLTPIGGSLIVDAFADEAERARRAQREEKRRNEEPAQRYQVAAAAGEGSIEEIVLIPEPDEPPPQKQEGELTDTGRLRLEVQEFMSRENAHHAEDDEIAEFMKERSGFDPSEMK